MEAQKEYRKDGKGKLWVYLNEYLTVSIKWRILKYLHISVTQRWGRNK